MIDVDQMVMLNRDELSIKTRRGKFMLRTFLTSCLTSRARPPHLQTRISLRPVSGGLPFLTPAGERKDACSTGAIDLQTDETILRRTVVVGREGRVPVRHHMERIGVRVWKGQPDVASFSCLMDKFLFMALT